MRDLVLGLWQTLARQMIDAFIDAALCCGSAGIYNMLQPEVAEELGQQKVTNLLNLTQLFD